jgi:hypothetical protein
MMEQDSINEIKTATRRLSLFDPDTLIDAVTAPNEFFREPFRLRDSSIYVGGYIVGAAAVIDRLGFSASNRDSVSGIAQATAGSWTSYWMYVLFAAMISGPIAWFIRGWWFHVRVDWSGGNSDLDECRRIWLMGEVFYALPLIILSVITTLSFPSPAEISDSVEIIFLLTVPVYVWSCWMNYRGASVRYGLSGVRPLIFLLGFPFVGALGIFALAVFRG